MATFSATASFSSTAGNLLIGTALSLNTPALQHSAKDASYATLHIAANSSQSLYTSYDVGASTPPITYVFAQASSANAGVVTIAYQTGSQTVNIARLTAGNWMYMPMASGSFQSSSLWAYTDSNQAYVSVLYAESGSL